MERGDGLQEEKVDTSSFASSDSSWTSFDLSTDLTSVGSDQVSTPPTAPGGDRHPKTPRLVDFSSEARNRQVAWRETSFLGSEE
ncbi:hypothetical protein VZT92_017876 [Zoarces viviparus]|uniref:Uncharacterized protein n=1 Tax=Zoarces viviparus TaxID=48416 RepID=A0AAW1EPQ2_ZOAVI